MTDEEFKEMAMAAFDTMHVMANAIELYLTRKNEILLGRAMMSYGVWMGKYNRAAIEKREKEKEKKK
jgi:hypothetical protein